MLPRPREPRKERKKKALKHARFGLDLAKRATDLHAKHPHETGIEHQRAQPCWMAAAGAPCPRDPSGDMGCMRTS